jgi:hypothetical protein
MRFLWLLLGLWWFHINFISILPIKSGFLFYLKLSSTIIHVHFICFDSLFLWCTSHLWRFWNSWLIIFIRLKSTFTNLYTFCLWVIYCTLNILDEWFLKIWTLIYWIFLYFFIWKLFTNFTIGNNISIKLSIDENWYFF